MRECMRERERASMWERAGDRECMREKVSVALPVIVSQLQAWKRDADQAP